MWYDFNVIKQKEYKKYSQNKEDGIIEHLLKSTNSYNDFYIEIGTQDGTECNSRLLNEKNVKGICFDAEYKSEKYNIKKEKFLIKPDYNTNLEHILNKYNLLNKNINIGMFSVDIDSFDIWIIRSLLLLIYHKKINAPSILVIERNISYKNNEVYFPPRQPTNWYWSNDGHMAIFDDNTVHKAGSSTSAFDSLLNKFNYKRVYNHCPNIFYVHNKYLPDNFKQPNLI